MSKKFLKAVGERIRDTRAYRYKNQIAGDAGVNPSQYTKIERGEANFTMETLERIAKALKVEPVELLPPKAPAKEK